jgi:cell division protein FtsI (penicillin-binding protein 3)
VGQKDVLQMIQNFGFGMKTGVDLMGEASGLMVRGPWPEHLFSNISFGQGVGVTALQMTNVFSAIANGGKLMKPFLIKRIVDSDQHVVTEREPEVIRQVLSPKEASILTLMLSGATEGTGKLARVDGYPVAGKTGTAQKVNPEGRGYIPNAHICSFAGFVPANNPQFAIYIAVDNPKKLGYGAEVAAPLFNHLASFALNQRGFMPIVVTPNLMSQNKNEKGETAPPSSHLVSQLAAQSLKFIDDGTIPDFSGLTVRDVGRVLKEYEKRGQSLDNSIELIGSGTVESQWPQAGQKLKTGQKIKLVFHSSG